jgi:formylglycine-generating enzyme
MNLRRFGLLAALFVVSCTSSTPPESAHIKGYAPRIRTSIGLELRLIPPGTFQMGSSDGPENERPVHEVRITYPYYMGVTEVTQEQFAAFVGETGYVTTAEKMGGAKVWRDGTWIMMPEANFNNVFPGPRRPVVSVSFHDAADFCVWLTNKEHAAGTLSPSAEIRLPTEAEWEYAARAGTDSLWSGATRFEDLCQYANVPDQFASRAGLRRKFIPCNDGIGLETAEVAHYRPNAFGLYDMTGNVWEWTLDRMGPYPSEKTTDPKGPSTGEERVMRGGSWSGDLHGLRVSHRDGYPPELRGGAIGFRVMLYDPKPAIADKPCGSDKRCPKSEP